ncbi:beta-glucosidase 11-like [Iris pallida]|uniref:Beta-glucosidase 11-like n=1 Tax=Iris pallida TaxID=29817 RepID=A0AAX6FJS3_IRIPA|nr:beta-glucosidase 11-like [Iris pallida]
MKKVWCVVLVVSIGLWWRDLDQVSSNEEEEDLRRDDFPKEFVFGSGTSAYQVIHQNSVCVCVCTRTYISSYLMVGGLQVEGAATEDGRTPSIWDTFARAGHLPGNSTGDIAADGYHKYKEDIKLMEETGLEGYREDFTAYADVCFREYGDRVSHWTTLNEPNVFVLGGYDAGNFPPGRCSYPFGNCSHGNSVMEPYIVAHNCLLAHSSVAALYKRKYQVNQKGLVGMNIFMYHLVPKSDSTEDIIAAKRAQEFYTDWFIHPFMNGDYPDTMKRIVGKKIPKFSKNESKQLVGALDFVGVNYYYTLFVKDDPTDLAEEQRDVFADMSVKLSATLGNEKAGLEIATPYGLQGVLEYLKQAYGNPPIYVHENGFALPHSTSLDDTPRIKYLSVHMRSLLNALRNGSNTLGYFTWSFLDLFELLEGYESSYGMYYVNFGDKQLKRYPKLSAHWYSNFLKRRSSIIHKDGSSYAPSV